MKRSAGICFGVMQVFLVLILSAVFSQEQSTPPAPELQVSPFCEFGTGKADVSSTSINPPDGLAFTDDGLLLATDAVNHRVQIFDPYSGKHVGSIGDSGLFAGEVVDIIALPDRGLLVSDENANQIYRFKRTAETPAVFQPVPPPLLAGEGFKKLCGMACDSKGRIYVVDGLTGKVRRYMPDFKPDPGWKFQSTRPDNEPMLHRAEGIAIDESNGMVFLSSDWDGMILAFDLETGVWTGKSIGRSADALTGKPVGQSVFSRSVEGLAVIDHYLLAVDEGEDSAAKSRYGHLLIFDLRKRMAGGAVDGLAGWLGNYFSPDAVAVFPGNAKHPEPLVAVANQGSYKVQVYKWEDIKNAIAAARAKGRVL
ncbi:MAG: hypothetical protein WC522_09280 [Candidatus Omnitrophota bacterium]